eukprot:TRINITY_DN10899_c0_g1_i3.p1 TRINITY_DN10899_c0_g1~~TRINITY_DN10899_c0_g1_i3.p1  ORF type:complete len:164 (+),score=62.88 TRINITY_DN10899_c0_g1_i3:366-857(+)
MKVNCEILVGSDKSDAELLFNKYKRELDSIEKKIRKKGELLDRFYKSSSLMGLAKDRREETKVPQSKNEMLMEGATRLKTALKRGEETHHTTIDIMETLQQQRRKLDNAGRELTGMEGNTEIATKFVKGMERKEFIYKGLLILISIMLLVVIGTLLFIKLNRR